MDRARKRKASGDEAVEASPKRQKVQSQPESTESTTKIGLHLVEQLRNAKDKNGRSISTLFLTLPDRREIPEYFEEIRLPIAIDTVEEKLRQRGYATLTQLESDVKRMVANAKQFNDEKSLVFGDAERIRKLLSNYMREHNPAYKDPNYTAFPTPIPDESSVNGKTSATPEVNEAVDRPKKTTITLSRARKASQTPAATPAVKQQSVEEDQDDFAGKDFQQAQVQIVEDLISYTDDEGLLIFSPFANLPPRSLTDYYKIIKHPVSLSSVKKRARGQHGREAATNITDFKSWDQFMDEVSYIWNNAREYNEDGSDMFELSLEFERHFRKVLVAARAKISEPQQPRIKLNARPKPVLHLGGKASPAPTSPDVAVDNESLARQNKVVDAGVKEQPSAQPAQPAQKDAAPKPASASPAVQPAVKTEKTPVPAPPPLAAPATAARPPSTAPEIRQPSQDATSMPPPPARVPSGSPNPATQPAPSPALAPVLPPPIHHIPTPPAPTTFIDNFSRSKPISEALLPTLHIASHPHLALAKPFKLDVPASEAYTHQSLTLALPANVYYLQLTPSVSQQLASGRQYKLFVTVNGARVMGSSKPVPAPLTNGVGAGAGLGGGGGPGAGAVYMNGDGGGGNSGAAATERRMVYDAALQHGVNRIEVEIVAAVQGAGTGTGTGTLETEKISAFVNLLRG